MFNFSIVSTDKYVSLCKKVVELQEESIKSNDTWMDLVIEKESLNKAVEYKDNEIKLLKKRIDELCRTLDAKSEESSGCSRGSQCVTCVHLRRVCVDNSHPIWTNINSYCAKCVHDMCPSFEKAK